MLSWIALFCLTGAATLLFVLAVIDLKTRLLPNELVLGFATLGFIFHLTTLAQFISIQNIFLGSVTGFAALYLVRAVANKVYNEDALGLGDVKLIGAAGVWVGPDNVMLAMAVGAMAALVHGFFYAMYVSIKTKQKPDFARLQIPAGPGFAIGIIVAGLIAFKDFRLEPL